MIAQEPLVRRWCWPFCIIFIVIVIIIMWVFVCPWTCAEDDPHLVIEHEDLVAFSQINNSFSIQYDTSKECNEDNNAWSGLLFHLGDYYRSDCATHNGVEITRASGDVDTLYTADFDWINIIAERDASDGVTDPMLPSEISKLVPTSLAACGTGAPLHSKMLSVADIITFWQGSDGYDFDARYLDDTPANARQNSYGLRINDPFEVWVYKLDETCAPVAPTGHTAPLHLTDVVKIRVMRVPPGVGSGVRMDPPMP